MDREGDISCRVIWHEHIKADRLIKISLLLQNFWDLHLLREFYNTSEFLVFISAKSLEISNTFLAKVLKAISTHNNQAPRLIR